MTIHYAVLDLEETISSKPLSTALSFQGRFNKKELSSSNMTIQNEQRNVSPKPPQTWCQIIQK